MQQPFANNSYVFDEQINVLYISNLYSGDYEIIGETFSDVNSEYPSLLENIEACWTAGDVAALKSAVHKIKPVFGFTGLLGLQEQCLNFEKACEVGPAVDELRGLYGELRGRLMEAKGIIEKETTGLALFNRR